jgi:aspartyl-tRNA(Asn)/glutamyl-tRNA(Gln) amidotransferase subunit A
MTAVIPNHAAPARRRDHATATVRDKVLANAPAAQHGFFRGAQGDRIMTDLTNLTVAESATASRRRLSAPRSRPAFNANVAAAKALNAFIVETPEKALAAADAADADRAAGTLKPLSGVPIGMKDLFCTEGVQTTAASHMFEGFVPPYESTVSGKLWDAGAGMLGKLNLDQFAMGSSNETSYFGNVISPWKRRGWRQCGAGAGRFVGRQFVGDRGAALPRGDRHRHRRFDPPACQPSSAFRASSRPMAAARAGGRRVRLVARSGRADGARRPRQCAIMLEAMAGFDPKDSTSLDLAVPQWEAGLVQRPRGQDASVFPRNIASTACPRDRGAVGKGHRDG